MDNYKFLKQKAFEKIESFEKRLSEMSGQGWKVINFTSDKGILMVMLSRKR